MYEENVLLLITALAQNAADEYREYMETIKNNYLTRREKEYFKLRAEETLSFFDSNLFVIAFPGKSEYIKDELRKEYKK